MKRKEEKMKKRNFVLRGFNAFTLAERICGSAGAKLPAGGRGLAAARSTENRLNPSPLAGETSQYFPSPLAGEGLGVRGNKGFTLAEVLITLVIIGVIGALTVPSLIQNTRKQEYVSALKKTYSTLSQAAQMILTEEGTPNSAKGGWMTDKQGTGEGTTYAMFKKHLNYIKEGDGRSVWGIKSYGKDRSRDWLSFGSADTLILADGAALRPLSALNTDCRDGWGQWETGSSNVCQLIIADVNGAKGPNRIGTDVFGFVLKETGLYPAGCDNNFDYCDKNKNVFGFGCTCKVLSEDAINY